MVHAPRPERMGLPPTLGPCGLDSDPPFAHFRREVAGPGGRPVFDAMASQDKTEGSVTTRLVESDIIETVYSGYISASMAGEVEADLRRLLNRHPEAHWLADASAATGIAVAPGESRTAVFSLFKGRTSRIAVIMNSTSIRMMVATFAFAFGVPMKPFERRSEAIDYLRGTRR